MQFTALLLALGRSRYVHLTKKPSLFSGHKRAIAKYEDMMSFKSIAGFHFQFDPWTLNTVSLRQVMFLLNRDELRLTNPRIEIKSKVVDDRSEPIIHARFLDGGQYLIKTANLTGVEIMQQLDRLVQIREPRPPGYRRPKLERQRGK